MIAINFLYEGVGFVDKTKARAAVSNEEHTLIVALSKEIASWMCLQLSTSIFALNCSEIMTSRRMKFFGEKNDERCHSTHVDKSTVIYPDQIVKEII